jgi:hypothetical protein
LGPSILGRQQNRRRCSLPRILDRFGDNPDFLAERRAVPRKNAGAVDESVVVRLTVFIADLAPVASGVPLEEVLSRLSGFFESFEGTGRGEDLAERELRLRFGDQGILLPI